MQYHNLKYLNNQNYSKLNCECEGRVKALTTHYYGLFCLVFNNENSEQDLFCGSDLFSLTKAHGDYMWEQTAGLFKKSVFTS